MLREVFAWVDNSSAFKYGKELLSSKFSVGLCYAATIRDSPDYQLLDGCQEQRSLEEDVEGSLDPTWVSEPHTRMILASSNTARNYLAPCFLWAYNMLSQSLPSGVHNYELYHSLTGCKFRKYVTFIQMINKFIMASRDLNTENIYLFRTFMTKYIPSADIA